MKFEKIKLRVELIQEIDNIYLIFTFAKSDYEEIQKTRRKGNI